MPVRLVLLGIFLGGGAICGYLTNADRGESCSIVGAGTLDAGDLQIGDCLDWPGAGGNDVEVRLRQRPPVRGAARHGGLWDPGVPIGFRRVVSRR
ncbi:MAG TPA: hypothetical protein VIW46_04650 [Acidimicrobiia bacterium]